MSIEGAPRQRNFYSRLWRATPRELGFLLLGFPIASVGFGLTYGLFSAGLATVIPLLIGVFIIIGALYVARIFGTVELIRLVWAGRPPIQQADWQDSRATAGFWSWLRSVIYNGH
ncbi:MAG TPA: sensor domain-containing protein, partial [Galbitalea sp.]